MHSLISMKWGQSMVCSKCCCERHLSPPLLYAFVRDQCVGVCVYILICMCECVCVVCVCVCALLPADCEAVQTETSCSAAA